MDRTLSDVRHISADGDTLLLWYCQSRTAFSSRYELWKVTYFTNKIYILLSDKSKVKVVLSELSIALLYHRTFRRERLKKSPLNMVIVSLSPLFLFTLSFDLIVIEKISLIVNLWTELRTDIWTGILSLSMRKSNILVICVIIKQQHKIIWRGILSPSMRKSNYLLA